MIAMRLSDIAAVTGGHVHGDDVLVTGPAYVDSRSPEDHGLFVAIAGEHVDGHEYAEGAHAVLGTRPTSAPTLVVEDAVAALGALSRSVARRSAARVYALTGSQGKTGTKDYLATVLAADAATVATRGNHNNEIGVPLTVLQTTADTRHLVVEMGARGPGHIAYLCELAPPDLAAVLNVGTAHLSEFGSREAIAAAKGEIVEALDADGTAVLNATDPLVLPMRERTRARVLTFGSADADVAVRDVVSDDFGRHSFSLAYDGGQAPVQLRQLGAHQVLNAAAAAGLALGAGLPLDLVAATLSTATAQSRWRMELHERSDGVAVINDAYNANPESTQAALDTLGSIGRRSGRRTIAVLGEMLELADPDADHHRVGRFAAEAGIDVLVTVGRRAATSGEGAGSIASWSGELVRTEGRADAAAWVRNNVARGDVVLVKASRGAALEHIVADLLSADGLPSEGDGDR
jgi:UDP-N-acetylmuramoyl-tripeptide--D-alanyl-D-alanine ligase